MRAQKNDMQFSKDHDAGACRHDYVSVVSRRAQLIQVQLAIQTMWGLIDWFIGSHEQNPKSGVLKFHLHLKCYVCHRWAFEDGLWNFDGQGGSLSFGAGFKQMEASCVFWKLKAWCVFETLKYSQNNKLHVHFVTLKALRRKCHVFSEILKSSQKNLLHVYSETLKAHKNKLHVCTNTLKLLLS
jgi:hypothetical protein